MKVLVSDPLSDEGIKILVDAGIKTDVKTGLSEDALCAIIGEYDGLVIRSGTKVTKKVLDAAKNLKAVGRAGVGVDNVDIPAATERGILVMNTPAANIVSAAEHSCALILSTARNIPWAHASMHAGKWERNKFVGKELNGKTLGIIGVGRVGGEVAKRLKHFNMEIIGYDPFLPKEVADSIGVRLTDLEEVLRKSDVMTIHTPLLPDTRNMISKKQFDMMKPNAMLVNVARGGIVDEKALYDALKSKRIAAAAVDVWVEEPLCESEKCLLELDNLVTTPHLGASTEEAQERVAVEIAHSMVRFLKEDTIDSAVNAPKGKLDPETAAYLPLAEDLGVVAHQVNGARPIDKLEIIACGETAKLDIRRISTSVVIGVLQNIIGEKANMINAMSIAKGKGISVMESKGDDNTIYDGTLTVKVTSGSETTMVRGTVFAGIPRLVGVNGYSFEMAMTSDLIITRYTDRPGVIGSVGKILGDANINVAQMTVGRSSPSGDAVMIMAVDGKVPPAIISKIDSEIGSNITRYINLL